VSRKPQAASRKPQAASRKPQAASRKPQAASRKRFFNRRLSNCACRTRTFRASAFEITQSNGGALSRKLRHG